MRSVTRLPGVRFRYHCLLLPLTFILLVGHLWAQDSDDEDDDDAPSGAFANVTLKYDARGNADVKFFAYGDVQNWSGIEVQLEQALHCPAGTLINPPPNAKLPKYVASRPAKEQERYREYAERTRKNTLEGKCPGAMSRAGLVLWTNIPLQPLTAELKGAGVKRLGIFLSYPKSKFSEHTPGIKLPWETEAADTPNPAAYEPYARANYSIDTFAPSLSLVHLSFGLRDRDAIRSAILPVAFLIAPILVCLWMRRVVLRNAEKDPTGAWFSYFRVLTWCGNCLVLIWMLGQTVRQGFEVIASYWTEAHTAGAAVLQVAILMLPPWLAFFICILLSFGIYRKVRGETWTPKEFFINQFLGIGTQFLPLACFFAAIGMISVNGQASVALFASVYVTYIGCKWLQAKYSGIHIEPLTQGELRDKVFEIAKKAAVEVRQVFIVPAGKSQMANAFASRNRMVLFTDYLLNRLNKREVSAIAAHEIAHIQRKHPAWKTAAFLVLIFASQILYGGLASLVGFLRHALQMRQAAEGPNGAAGLAALVHFGDQVLAFPELILVLFVFALFLYHLHSQHLEYVADAGAIQFTGDPEAMITSLLKLGRLNQTPVQWDRATGSLLTHPSTLKRVQRIARAGQVPAERLQQLLVECASPQAQVGNGETWETGEQFQVANPANPVVTLRSESMELAIKIWSLRLAVIGPAALIAWSVSHYHLQHKAALLTVGGMLCFGAYVVVNEWQATWFRDGLKRKFMAKLAEENITLNADQVRLVSLSPHATPRVYAFGYSWDTGSLILSNDRLCYIGDQTRFALKREQVIAIRLGQGVPDWVGEPRTYIEWRAEPGAAIQTLNLLPKDPYAALGNRRQCVELAAELERWKAQPHAYGEVPPVLQNLPCPSLGEITNQRLKSAVTIGRFLKVALFAQVLVIVLWIVLSLPFVLFASLVQLFAVVYSFSPFWFYKEVEETGPDAIPALDTQPGD